MEYRLNKSGILSIQELYNISPKHMRKIWGNVQGEKFWYMLRGKEIADIKTERKTIGHSHVLEPKWRLVESAEKVMLRLLLKAASRLRRIEYYCSRLSLSIRTENNLRLEGKSKFYRACDNKKLQEEATKIWKKLIKKRLTISVAESCTGGLLAHNLTKLSNSSKYFKMGLITYSNQAKIKILKINKNIIRKFGAVSNECCKAMVQNLSKISKSKINVSITGIAGPGGGSKEKPVGLVYIGVKKGATLLVKENKFKKKNRNSVQKSTVNTVIKIISKII